MERKYLKSRNEARHRLRSRFGQEAAEFALALPLFAYIMLGTIEVGWALYKQAVINYGTREGARYASTEADTSWQSTGTISASAQNTAKNLIDLLTDILPSQVNITMSWVSQPDRTFTVTATCPFTPVFGKLVPIVSSRTQYISRVTMFCETCG